MWFISRYDFRIGHDPSPSPNRVTQTIQYKVSCSSHTMISEWGVSRVTPSPSIQLQGFKKSIFRNDPQQDERRPLLDLSATAASKKRPFSTVYPYIPPPLSFFPPPSSPSRVERKRESRDTHSRGPTYETTRRYNSRHIFPRPHVRHV